MGILQVLVETEWIGVKELGRIEQTCSSNKLPENVWEAYCFRMWPSTQYFFEDEIRDCFGGFRGYTKRKSRTRKSVCSAMPTLLETKLEPDDITFFLDIYLDGECVRNSIVPISFMRDDKPNIFPLKEPIVLGKAKCFYEDHCSCEKKCRNLYFDNDQFPFLCVKLTMVRQADFVEILDPKDYFFELVFFGDGLQIEPNKSKKGSFIRRDDPDDQSWVQSSNIAIASKEKKYEDFGLPLIGSSQSSAIQRRLKNRPIEIGVSFKIDLLGDGKTYGFSLVEVELFYGELTQRHASRDRLDWEYLCVEKGWEKFKIKRMHVFEQLDACAVKET